MSDIQKVFIAVSIIIILIIIFLYIYHPIKNIYGRHRYHKIYRFILNVISKEKKCILLNNLALPIGGNNFIHIDHLLFADKYIYVIKDRYISGSLEALENNRYWFSYNLKGEQTAISNSLSVNQERIDKLALLTGVEHNLFVNVVLLNDNCNLAPTNISKPNTYIIKLRYFKSFLRKKESQNVAPLNRIQLEKLANDIARLSQIN